MNRIASPQLNIKFKHENSTAQKKHSEQATKLKTYNPIIYSNKYNELLTENASFIDSPIHLLMSHHKNQRMLKQKKYELEYEKQLNRRSVMNNNLDHSIAITQQQNVNKFNNS